MTTVGDRWLRIVGLLVDDESSEMDPKRLCVVSAEVTWMTGAGIMLMNDEGSSGSLCASDQVSALINEIQFTLGEGPCVDAYDQQRPVMEPHLGTPVVSRWHAFTGQMIEAGAQAVFAFPVQIGAVKLGAISLYRDRPGPMTDEQHADSIVFAEIAARVILDLQSNAPPGALTAELGLAFGPQNVIHQATGMVAIQLGASLGSALVRLRAYAFRNDQPLEEVARDVVARKLRFHPERSASDTGS
jgi:hypothetical protein